MLEWADRRAWTAPSPPGPAQLPPETLLAKATAAQPGAAPIGAHAARRSVGAGDGHARRQQGAARRSVYRRDHRRAAGRDALVLPDDDRVASLPRARGREPRHRQGDHRRGQSRSSCSSSSAGSTCGCRACGRGSSSRTCCGSARASRRRRATSTGTTSSAFWSAVPLAIVVAGAVPISYPWASNLVYRIAGDTPPPARRPQPRAAGRARKPRDLRQRWRRRRRGRGAEQQIPAWRTMTTRLATIAKAPIVITVDEGYGGQPQKRHDVHVRSRVAARS